MKSIIQFQISESDGGYVAEGVSVPIVTQGDTLDELASNIREAVGLYVNGEWGQSRLSGEMYGVIHLCHA